MKTQTCNRNTGSFQWDIQSYFKSRSTDFFTTQKLTFEISSKTVIKKFMDSPAVLLKLEVNSCCKTPSRIPSLLRACNLHFQTATEVVKIISCSGAALQCLNKWVYFPASIARYLERTFFFKVNFNFTLSETDLWFLVISHCEDFIQSQATAPHLSSGSPLRTFNSLAGTRKQNRKNRISATNGQQNDICRIYYFKLGKIRIVLFQVYLYMSWQKYLCHHFISWELLFLSQNSHALLPLFLKH